MGLARRHTRRFHISKFATQTKSTVYRLKILDKNPENVAKLEAFVTTANKEDGSHFLDVPMGINMITDVLITSPICLPEEMGGGA